jgi:hypothetical protein
VRLLALTSIVCAAWFKPLPDGWHQSAPTATILHRGVSVSNTSSWAASFRPSPRYGISKNFPRDGVYVWVLLERPTRRLGGDLLRLPLRLRDASIMTLEGALQHPEYRFEGRYHDQYEVMIGVDFGRAKPTRRMFDTARTALHRLVFPRWVPAPERCPA